MAQSTTIDTARIQMWGPQTPIKGMCSAKERSLMSQGEFVILRDLRCDSGLPAVRLGVSSILSKPSWALTQLPLGACCCQLNGNLYVVAVFSDGTRARVVVAPEGATSPDRWVEVTSDIAWTGPSGNNRFTNLTADYNFTTIRTPRADGPIGADGSRDCLLIVNGDEYNRIWDPDVLYTSQKTVTAVASNAGLVRLTIGAHHYVAGDHIYVVNVGGLPNLTSVWTVSSTTATTVTLLGSVFSAGFTAGGFVEDRIDLLVHKPLSFTGSVDTAQATLNNYADVSATNAYYAVGTVNQARFKLEKTVTAPYVTENAGVLWTITNAAVAGDIATVYFTSAFTLGRQLLQLWEGAEIYAMLSQCKIEIGLENVAYNLVTTWTTIYDPTGADPIQQSLVASDIIQSLADNRAFPLFNTGQHDGTSGYHLRFTRQGSAPAATQTAILLFSASAQQGTDLTADTKWTDTFTDETNEVEGPGIVMTADAVNVGNLGGVRFVKTSTGTTGAPKLPLDARLVVDWQFSTTNPADINLILGGLDGKPEKIALYAKWGDMSRYYLATFQTFYDPVLSGGTQRAWFWNITTGLPQTSFTLFPGFLKQLLTTSREAPNTFQMCIPICSTCLYANGRLFIGSVKDQDRVAEGDVYFSWDRNPFRFQQTQDDELRGGFFQVAGEKIKKFLASASSSLGAGRVWMWSSHSLYALGDSGPFNSGGFLASDLSRPKNFGPHGTLSPMSVCQGYNAMCWLDQDAQWMRFAGGVPENIGKYTVADRLEAIPASRKPRVASVFKNDRFYLGYTPGNETENNRVLVWNERMGGVESEDYPKNSAYKFENAMIYSASSSINSTSRMFFFHTDGSLKAYEENASNDDGTAIMIRMETASIAGDWESFFIKECNATSGQNTGGAFSISRVSRRWGADEGWTTTMSQDITGSDYATYRDTFKHTKTGVNRGIEKDNEWWLDIQGNFAPRTKFLSFGCTIEGNKIAAGKR